VIFIVLSAPVSVYTVQSIVAIQTLVQADVALLGFFWVICNISINVL